MPTDHMNTPEAADLRGAAHALEMAIRFAESGIKPSVEEVTDWKVELAGLRRAASPEAAGWQDIAAAPKGWKLVPAEPTEEMAEAGTHRRWNYATRDPDCSREIWQSMLSAAPPPPGSSEGAAEFDRDDDGELLMDWSPAKGRMVTLSLRADGRLSYAITWDGEKAHGAAQMPPTLAASGASSLRAADSACTYPRCLAEGCNKTCGEGVEAAAPSDTEAIRYALDCIKASTEYRVGSPAFEYCEQLLTNSLRAGAKEVPRG